MIIRRPAGSRRLLSALSFFAIPVLVLAGSGVSGSAAAPGALATVRNPVAIARPSETVGLKAVDLREVIGVDDLRNIHVTDRQSGRELLTQSIDYDGDGVYDELLFQTDLAPQQTKTFLVTAGERQTPRREDFKAYGRFVRERLDDFAWENDRIAHRMYGAALETWPREPLTSSGIDVWTKRVPRLVINDWYMTDDYHRDNGEGGDFYYAGASRGCGGNGIWVAGKLYPSANFRKSRVLANGPIRVMFELSYDPWEAAHGIRLSEVKRISLDAGQNLTRFESRYHLEGGPANLASAAGIRKGTESRVAVSTKNGTMRTWESLKENGHLGCAIVVVPHDSVSSAEDGENYFLTMNVGSANTVTYYAGFGWSKSSQFRTLDEWDRYVSEFAGRLRAPVQVTLTPAAGVESSPGAPQ